MLSDQIESATEKVGDMEKLLDDKKEVSHEIIKYCDQIFKIASFIQLGNNRNKHCRKKEMPHQK